VDWNYEMRVCVCGVCCLCLFVSRLFSFDKYVDKYRICGLLFLDLFSVLELFVAEPLILVLCVCMCVCVCVCV